MSINFITLRQRSKKMLDQIRQMPVSALRKIELRSASRIYRNPKILDQKITLKDYQGSIRQLVITDLGHEDQPVSLVCSKNRQRGEAKMAFLTQEVY